MNKIFKAQMLFRKSAKTIVQACAKKVSRLPSSMIKKTAALCLSKPKITTFPETFHAHKLRGRTK